MFCFVLFFDRLWNVGDANKNTVYKNLGGITDGKAQLFSCAHSPKHDLVVAASYHGNVYLVQDINNSMGLN